MLASPDGLEAPDRLALKRLAPNPERLAYSPAEAASALGVCRATIYNLITRGELRVIKLGRSTRITASELDRLLSAGGAA